MSDTSFTTSLGTVRGRTIGTGPVAVLWHSMFVDSHSWDRVIDELGLHRTLVIVDGPGSGLSDPLTSPRDIAACADAAASVVEQVKERHDVTRVDWLGNAWGGHVGLHLAATRGDLVRSLVAISAPTFPIDASLRRKIQLLLPLYRLIGARGPVRSAVEDGVFTDFTRAHDPEAIAVLADSLRRSGRAMIDTIRTGILNRTDLDWAALQTTCPTLFVATDDRGEWTLAEAKSVADRMADAHASEIRSARVIPALEQPADTARVITRFWSDVDARATEVGL